MFLTQIEGFFPKGRWFALKSTQFGLKMQVLKIIWWKPSWSTWST